MDRDDQINTFTRITQVSRETIYSLKKYEELLLKANKNLNLIGKSTINNIWNRHFLDSAQVIDFINKNECKLVDLGSGAGFPGIVIAILAKDRKIPIKINLIDKSPKKIKFLKDVIQMLSLNAEAITQNILDDKTRLKEELIIARAFKPLELILQLIHKKADNWEKIFLFQGKSGQKELLQASKSWDIKYKQRKSITSNDSFVIEINELKKIN